MNNDPFAREPTAEEKALLDAKTKVIKALGGAMSMIVIGWVAMMPALAIIAWKAALS